MAESERGVLTDADEEYLRNPDKVDRKQAFAARRRIKKRIAEAMSDFKTVFDHLDDEELQDLFEDFDDYVSYEEGDSEVNPDSRRVEVAGENIVAFLYKGFNLLSSDPETLLRDGPTTRGLAFRRTLCQGIKRGSKQFDSPESTDDSGLGSSSTPDRVLIESNTPLVELPSRTELSPYVETKDWSEMNEREKSRLPFESELDEQDLPIDKEEAVRWFQRYEIEKPILQELFNRRTLNSDPIIRYDETPW